MYTELQEDAIERIRFYQSELLKRGHRVRLSIEQEFAVAHHGGPTLDAIKPDTPYVEKERVEKFNDYGTVLNFLKSRNLPTLTMLEREGASRDERLQIYETKFDSGSLLRPDARTPLDVALDTLKFRQQTIGELLQQTTCLSSDWAGKELTALFDPVPYAHLPKATMGLHANMSVYDDEARNLFVDEKNGGPSQMLYDVADRLKQLQYHGGLAFIQTPEALARFGINESAPDKIGLGEGQLNRDKTIMRRHTTHIFKKEGKDQTSNNYLENRMMPANADPLVITALQLAAVYDVVINPKGVMPSTLNVRKKTMGDKDITFFNETTFPLEKTMQPWIDRFKAEDHIKKLLGDKLYQGILKTYGGQATAHTP